MAGNRDLSSQSTIVDPNFSTVPTFMRDMSLPRLLKVLSSVPTVGLQGVERRPFSNIAIPYQNIYPYAYFHRFSIVCVLSGGNINSSRMSRVIDRGMAAEGRLVKFSVALPDVPGAMAKLLAKVTDNGADVKSFVPERAWMRRDIFTVSVTKLITSLY